MSRFYGSLCISFLAIILQINYGVSQINTAPASPTHFSVHVPGQAFHAAASSDPASSCSNRPSAVPLLLSVQLLRPVPCADSFACFRWSTRGRRQWVRSWRFRCFSCRQSCSCWQGCSSSSSIRRSSSSSFQCSQYCQWLEQVVKVVIYTRHTYTTIKDCCKNLQYS